jgi:glycosyltransferase involved in cell wall biosynthesis
MNILMLAPEPFFEPRGTPISVYFRILALGKLGHSVTLITYPLGKPVRLKNLDIIRLPNLFFLKKIKIGPSLAKIPLDVLLFLRASWEMARNTYDLIFSHEEAALLGVWLAKLWKKPHIYDMHSSLPQQLENFEFTRFRLWISLFRRMEQFILRGSLAVIVICRDLMDTVVKMGHGGKAVLLENFLDFPGPEFSAEEITQKKRVIAPHGEKIVLYAGNFEPYQGISLLLEAAGRIEDSVIFLLVGGTGQPLTEMKKRAIDRGLADRVVFVDKVPPSEVSLYIGAADVLVSPRLSGTNTPLKIYSFLKSGKPLVATNLWTHTQVLSSRIAILADADPRSLAEGIAFALNSEEAKARARTAQEEAEKEYTEARYLEKMNQILAKASRA